MKIAISKEGDDFVVDPIDIPGSPRVGRGKTMMEALGAFFHAHQKTFDVTFEVDPSAQQAEDTRRRLALVQR